MSVVTSSLLFFFFLFCTSEKFIVSCEKFRSPYLGQATVATRAALPIPTYQCVQYFCVSKQWHIAAGVGDFLTCAKMVMHAVAHSGSQTPEESLRWKLTLGEMYLVTLGGHSNPHHYCARLFSLMVYHHPSYLTPFWCSPLCRMCRNYIYICNCCFCLRKAFFNSNPSSGVVKQCYKEVSSVSSLCKC